MKAFVLNLKRRPDRRAYMEAQLRELGLEAEFVEAIDGYDLPASLSALYDEALAVRRNGKALAPGELGCALSHRAVYERMINEDIPLALVLEDDVALSRYLVAALSDARLCSSTDWDWLQIDYVAPGLPFLRGWLASSWIEIQRRPAFAIYAALKLPVILALALGEWIRDALTRPERPRVAGFARPLYLASCYVITRAGAQTLLALNTPVVYPADRLPNQARLTGGFCMRALVPLLTKQERNRFVSDIASHA